LATGYIYSSLEFYFARGANTISQIISETTKKIWECLVDEYMPIPTEEQWMRIAHQYYRLWNLPNCVGAIDGKQIGIQKVPNTGSTNLNYKTYHSIVLMACSDAEGNFIILETGFAGRNSDGDIFRASKMGHWLERDGLNLPNPRPLPNDPEICFPFYFVADEAFPLKKKFNETKTQGEH
jgi:hypothetical protein